MAKHSRGSTTAKRVPRGRGRGVKAKTPRRWRDGRRRVLPTLQQRVTNLQQAVARRTHRAFEGARVPTGAFDGGRPSDPRCGSAPARGLRLATRGSSRARLAGGGLLAGAGRAARGLAGRRTLRPLGGRRACFAGLARCCFASSGGGALAGGRLARRRGGAAAAGRRGLLGGAGGGFGFGFGLGRATSGRARPLDGSGRRSGLAGPRGRPPTGRCACGGAIVDEVISDLVDGSHSEQRSEEHTSELQSRENLVCRLLLEKKKAKLATHI